MIATQPAAVASVSPGSACKTPLRGALVLGGATEAALVERLRAVEGEAAAGRAPAPAAPAESDPRAYPSFNAFFTRALREGVRTPDPDPCALLMPADGLERDRLGPAPGRRAGWVGR